MANPPDKYSKPRVFVRGLESSQYSLTEARRQRLAEVRTITPKNPVGGKHGEKNILGPGDDPFRTQSLQAHFVTLEPNSRDKGHGHQNEAFMYVLKGRGFDIHDGIRYDWEAGDAMAVHNDTVHWHTNLSVDEPALILVMKAKPLWIFLGLHLQGPIGTAPPDDDRWGPAEPFAILHDPKDADIPCVVKPHDTPWRWTPHGYIRELANADVPLRVKAIDVHLQEIPPSSRSGKQWQMGDEIFFVLDGEGYDLHWDVDVELCPDGYYAHVAKEPVRVEWKTGDLVYIPHNAIHQHFNSQPDRPAQFIAATNRIFRQLGYSRVEQLEYAPQYQPQSEVPSR